MKLFFNYFIITILLLTIASCSEKTDEDFIKKDRENLNLMLQEDNVVFYKGLKTFARYSLAPKQNKSLPYQAEFASLQISNMTKVADRISGVTSSTDSVSVLEEAATYYKAYKEYQALRELFIKIEEDSLPTFIELLNKSNSGGIKDVFSQYDLHQIEHLFLGVSIYAPQKLPKPLVVYEFSKVDMNKLGPFDIRCLAQSIKGLLLTQYGFHYLSELEHTENIKILESDAFAQTILQPVVPASQALSLSSKERLKLELHSINLMCRALARVSMEREDKKELAIKDCEEFLENAQKLGWDNELVWICAAYVGLMKEDKEQAITNLRKLEKSTFGSEDTKLIIHETIGYLENREPDKAFNTFRDKAFMAKLTFQLVMVGIEKSGIYDKFFDKGSKELSAFKNRLENESDDMMKVFQPDQLKATKDEIMKHEEELIKKAKEWL